MFDFSAAQITALLTVVGIDIALAGDNALIVGMAAAGLPAHLRRRAILLGIAAAASLRIVFSVITVHLLQIVGLTALGGVLLLWVSWKLWHELRNSHAPETHAETSAPPKTIGQAFLQIFIADISMSLDNVLAVAGAAREHAEVLVFGLALSVVLMAVAAELVARLIARFHWIGYAGLALVLYVSLSMLWDGGWEVARYSGWA